MVHATLTCFYNTTILQRKFLFKKSLLFFQKKLFLVSALYLSFCETWTCTDFENKFPSCGNKDSVSIYSLQYNTNRSIIPTGHYLQYKCIFCLIASTDCLSDHPMFYMWSFSLWIISDIRLVISYFEGKSSYVSFFKSLCAALEITRLSHIYKKKR